MDQQHSNGRNGIVSVSKYEWMKAIDLSVYYESFLTINSFHNTFHSSETTEKIFETLLWLPAFKDVNKQLTLSENTSKKKTPPDNQKRLSNEQKAHRFE